jgi:hypothetical protein
MQRGPRTYPKGQLDRRRERMLPYAMIGTLCDDDECLPLRDELGDAPFRLAASTAGIAVLS